jgi:hypothetical protein
MGLINFKDIDFNKSINKENKVINFNGSEIEIVNYLSTNDKYDLIMITLQKAFEKNIYNPFKMDVFFNLNVIYLYTNIVFSTADREDESALYDVLYRSGLIDAVIAEIDADELASLKNYVCDLARIITQYRNTFGSVVGGFIEQLPAMMEKAREVIEKFDPTKMQELMTIANQIKTNIAE